MQIQAAVLESVHQPLRVQTIDLAEPQEGEVLVQIKAVGVCHSDWHLVTGDTKHPMPVVLGHEGSGVVAGIGPNVQSVKVGDHVSLNWAPSCGQCFYCGAGRPSLCDAYVGPIWAGTMLDGSTRLTKNGDPIYAYSALACFAEYAVVPSVCCVSMPNELPFSVAAVIGCAVTTGIGAVINTAQVPKGATVVVFGVGGVGLSSVMGAVLAGASKIIAVDRLASRLEAALQLGATHAINANEDVQTEVRQLTDGRGADFVFEASGLPSVQELCLQVARPGGTIIFEGLSPMGSSTNLPGAQIVRQEKSILGSYYGSSNPQIDFRAYGDLFLQGKLPLDMLISKSYKLTEINEAFSDMIEGKVRRGIVEF